VYAALRGYVPELVRSADVTPSSTPARETYEGVIPGAYEIELDKTVCVPGETIIVTVSGVPDEMLRDKPYVAVHTLDGGHREYMSWDWVSGSSGNISLNAPLEPGEYEIRAYAKNDVYIDANLVEVKRFNVR
jgi:hypothetical protein